jgi:D-glycerate 3-kinase
VSPDPTALALAIRAIAVRLPAPGARPLVIGLCGAQGSGKSTLAAGLAAHFEGAGVATALLSIDDLYLTGAVRAALAREVHPLLRTRGVPGTHDVSLGLAICDRIDRHEAVPLPRFDKAQDDRLPVANWAEAAADTRLLIFEGWCVGALPQSDAALVEPINELERTGDPHGIWRRYVNAVLAGPYQRLFARIDLLILLAAPDFSVVRRWRTEQEQALRAHTGQGMTDDDIVCFIAHYERLTRHILAEMPGRADVVLSLDSNRAVR